MLGNNNLLADKINVKMRNMFQCHEPEFSRIMKVQTVFVVFQLKANDFKLCLI